MATTTNNYKLDHDDLGSTSTALSQSYMLYLRPFPPKIFCIY